MPVDMNWIDNRSKLIPEIEQRWSDFMAYVDSLSDEQLTAYPNPDGWNGLDHLTHVTAWEESVINMLTRQPRRQGLNVPDDVWASRDYDAVNEVIRQNRSHLTIQQVKTQLAAKHAHLVDLVQALDDDGLQATYHSYYPDLDAEQTQFPIIRVIVGSTAAHYPDHIEWMQQHIPQT